MATVQQARDALVLANQAGNISDEEFLLLFDKNKSRNPDFPYWKNKSFELDSMSDDECKAEFRFYKNDVYLLAETLKCYNGIVVDGIGALCVLLKRFACPCRYGDMIPRFGRQVSQLSMISNQMMDFISDEYGHVLSDLVQPWLSPDNLRRYADVIHEKGAALDNCWGFIDGTVRSLCRLNKNQRFLYNEHKRIHAVKFQSVVAPNGLIASLYGPVEG